VAFLIYRWSPLSQIAFSVGLLILTEVLYRFTHVPGFDLPFTDQHNFGNYVDLILMNKINGGGWVAINCIPTAAHTIWGVLAGKLLLSEKSSDEKIIWLVVTGLASMIIGYALDFTLTPIIKRIATSSFVFASGGWCLIGLSLCYWWIDVRAHRKHLELFTIVGMNSLFIYLFIEIVASRWFNGYIGAISNGLMSFVHFPTSIMYIITSLILFALEWKMCQFLYKKGIFFKI
jgi:predicted acyltransferase